MRSILTILFVTRSTKQAHKQLLRPDLLPGPFNLPGSWLVANIRARINSSHFLLSVLNYCCVSVTQLERLHQFLFKQGTSLDNLQRLNYCSGSLP